MKSRVITWMLLVAISLLSATKASITLNYQVENFEFLETEDGTQIQPRSNFDYVYSGEAGSPNLPYKQIRYSVPIGAEFTGIDVSYDLELVDKDITIAQAQNEYPTSISKKDIVKVEPNPLIYNSQKMFPEKNCTYTSSTIIRCYKYLSFLQSPFIYYPASKELWIVTNIKIDIEYSDFKNATSLNWDDGSFGEELKRIVVNPNDVSTCTNRSPSNPNDVSYLILTNNELSDNFEVLADWKTQKGVPAEIITTEFIYSNFPGATNQLKIKNCIHDYYLNKGTTWFLLGGDIDVIPDQDCYAECGSCADATIPADLFYSCFDLSFNWDANNNGICGETTDNIDLGPEVYIGRASVTDATVDSFVNKTVNYEQYPPSSNFATEMLMSGIECWHSWGYPINSDAYWRLENMWNNYISPYWSSGTHDKLYDSDTSFEGASYDVTENHVKDRINTGYGFMVMCTHGSTNLWVMESGDYFDTETLSSLSNSSTQGIIATTACNTNSFDSSQLSLGEGFTRRENGGAVAYIGSSRYGWGNGFQVTADLGSSLTLIKDFYQCLFMQNSDNQSFHLGACFNYSKNMLPDSFNSYSWLMYSHNLLGDPELPLLTEDPQDFIVNISNSNIGINIENSITVETGVFDALVCLKSEDDVYQYGKTDVNGSITFTFTPETNSPITLTVTAPNYKCYIRTIKVLNFINGNISLEGYTGNPPHTGITRIILTNENGEEYFYFSNSDGSFSFPCPEDEEVTLVFQHNSNNFENKKYPDQAPGLIDLSTSISIQLVENCDRIIRVPYDYQSIQEAIDRIQDDGIVVVFPNQDGSAYQVSNLSWRHKHIRLFTNQQDPAELTSTNHAIKLDWEGIDNTDTIEGFRFEECQTYTRGPAITLLNGASPIVDRCYFFNNSTNYSGCNNYDLSDNCIGVGGAVFVQGVVDQEEAPMFQDCIFDYNHCDSVIGGGALALSGSIDVQSCSFISNFSDTSVGGSS